MPNLNRAPLDEQVVIVTVCLYVIFMLLIFAYPGIENDDNKMNDPTFGPKYPEIEPEDRDRLPYPREPTRDSPKYPENYPGDRSRPQYPENDPGDRSRPQYPENDPGDRNRPQYPQNYPGDRNIPQYPTEPSRDSPKYPQNDPGDRSRPQYPQNYPGDRSRPQYPQNYPGDRSRPQYPQNYPGDRSRPQYPPNDPGDRIRPPTPREPTRNSPKYPPNYPGDRSRPQYPTEPSRDSPKYPQNDPGDRNRPPTPREPTRNSPKYPPNYPGGRSRPQYPQNYPGDRSRPQYPTEPSRDSPKYPQNDPGDRSRPQYPQNYPGDRSRPQYPTEPSRDSPKYPQNDPGDRNRPPTPREPTRNSPKYPPNYPGDRSRPQYPPNDPGDRIRPPTPREPTRNSPKYPPNYPGDRSTPQYPQNEPRDRNKLPRGPNYPEKNPVSPGRDSNTGEFFVELYVFVDPKLVHLKGGDHKEYILNLISEVNDLYHHSSLNHKINIAVIGMEEMEEKEVGLNFADEPDCSKYERVFCSFKKILFKNRGVPEPDISVYMSVRKLCRNNRCNVLGCAFRGGLCSDDRNCFVMGDTRWNAAVTATHELGHLFSMWHDQVRVCQQFGPISPSDNVIMSEVKSYAKLDKLMWSKCSNLFMDQFFAENQHQCILNKPTVNHLDNFRRSRSRRSLYSPNGQCRLIYGHHWEFCNDISNCSRLYCSPANAKIENCVTNGNGLADGTECGHNKTCYRGECVYSPVANTNQSDGVCETLD